MKTEDTLGVALVKELCPICGKEMDGTIIMNKWLSKPNKKKIESMHNKVIGFANHCCEECAKHKDKVMYFIGVDWDKSIKNEDYEVTKIENFYRTGNICGVKKDSPFVNSVRENKLSITLKDNTEVCFIDDLKAKELELWQ